MAAINGTFPHTGHFFICPKFGDAAIPIGSCTKRLCAVQGGAAFKFVFHPMVFLSEREYVARMIKKNPNSTPQEIYKKIFKEIFNRDGGEGNSHMHNFVLTGGQIFHLPKDGDMYGQPLSYLTFFQEVVRMIGLWMAT